MTENVDERLSHNRYYVNEGTPHIELDPSCTDVHARKALVNACPAGLYRPTEEGGLSFDYAGCLECGTCRIIALGTALRKWEYPEGSFGVEYRLG